MRVLVCGGRDFTDSEFLYKILDKIHKKYNIDCIIEGDAKGADRMSGYWAKKNKVTLLIEKAEWDVYGKSAGIRRNLKMLDLNPDLVVGFNAGKGTRHTLTEATKRSIPVVEFLNRERIKNEYI